MTSVELSKALWDLANSITAFAAIQGLVFVYACLKKETGDVLNKKRLKAAITAAIVFMAFAQCAAVEWCRSSLCGLDAAHCQIYSQASIWRSLCIGGIAVCGILILYARQLFAGQPFDG